MLFNYLKKFHISCNFDDMGWWNRSRFWFLIFCSMFPKSTHETFSQKLYQTFQKNKRFSKPKLSRTDFTIVHYAGEVSFLGLVISFFCFMLNSISSVAEVSLLFCRLCTRPICFWIKIKITWWQNIKLCWQPQNVLLQLHFFLHFQRTLQSHPNFLQLDQDLRSARLSFVYVI